jgi:WD40 repeat protein
MASSLDTRMPNPPSSGISRRALLGWGIATGVVVAGGLGYALTRALTSSRRISELSTYRGHSQAVNALAWSPDGAFIASSSWDGTIQVWESATAKKLLTYSGHAQFPDSVSWSPDGTQLVSTGEGGSLHVWRAATGALQWSYQDELWRSGTQRAAWSPDGARIATAGFPAPFPGGAQTTLMVWDAANGRRLVTYHNGSIPAAVAWSPDSARLATGGSNQTVAVWPANPDTQTDGVSGPSPESIWRNQGEIATITQVVWSPDGARIASCGTKPIILFGSNGGVRLWNAATGQRALTYTGHDSSVDLQALAWSPDGKYLASGGTDQIVSVWGARTGEQLAVYRGHVDQPPIPESAYPYAITALAWSPDSARIVSSAFRGPVHVWSVSS